MWISVSLFADADRAEALADALMEHGALTASIEDADAGTEAETPQFGEPGNAPFQLWTHSKIVALFEERADSLPMLAAAAGAAGFETVPQFTVEKVAEQNWVQLTQSQFEPIKITERLWIVPSWHEAPTPEAINIALDPGMAFGTGSHPTTHLCLAWLAEHATQGCTVLDYGCGSGILGIAAAKLGANQVVGVDIDEKALEAAADNAQRNQVHLDLTPSHEKLDAKFDIVVANILTNPLCVLAPLLSSHVAPDGHLVLAGVLESQTTQVITAYAPFIQLTPGDTKDGWVRLEGTRPCSKPL